MMTAKCQEKRLRQLPVRMEAEIVKEKQVVSVFYYKGKQDNAALFAALPMDNNTTIVHLYSNFGLKDTKAFAVLMKKAEFMNEPYTAFCDGKPAMSFIDGAAKYEDAFEALVAGEYQAERIDNDAFMDLANNATSESEDVMRPIFYERFGHTYYYNYFFVHDLYLY